MGIKYGELKIQGKPICVVEKHNQVFPFWARLSQESGKPFFLLSFDQHMDCFPPFNAQYAWFCERTNRWATPEDFTEYQAQQLSQFDRNSLKSMQKIAEKLFHTEQITAALKLGFVNDALLLCSSEHSCYRDEGVCVAGLECYVNCQKEPHDDDCNIKKKNDVIETVNIEMLLTEAIELTQKDYFHVLEEEDYLLDIDLDVFQTKQSLYPRDPRFFNDIIQGAKAISIATEPGYIDIIDGPKIRVMHIHQRILEMIRTALS